MSSAPVPVGGRGVLLAGLSLEGTSFPDPVLSHPPPKQSRLHHFPSHCILQFPPGHDIMHISADDLQYILQYPFVHVCEHCSASHIMFVQLAPQVWVQLSAVQVNLVQDPPWHEPSQDIAVHSISQPPWAQVCWHSWDSLFEHSKLHLPPLHALSHSDASHFMLHGPLQSCVHSLESAMKRRVAFLLVYLRYSKFQN